MDLDFKSVGMSEWKTIELKEAIISASTGLDAIKRAPIVTYSTPIRCLRIQDVSQKKEFGKWGYTEVEDKNYEKFQLKKGDIIIARTGNTVGVNKYIDSDVTAVFNNGLIRLRINPSVFDSKFVYFNFRTSDFVGFIANISGGTSTQPNMQINALLTFEIPLLSLPEQRAIAAVLTSLDDKIDLLHRQNKTLEAMAETLFRQ
jgi:type I restriction enzyme S subunit